ncbi:MAG: hypothetical protein DLM52_07700 [Chthoniobacterales bacterium]|nr:MAG: hypothetical protein DLM52_07700 [Chthoniobacterales bacterium]
MAENFRLAVLNPAGRDPEQHFREGPSASGKLHAPVNFHAYAACTGGAVFRETKRAVASGWPVLLMLRSDFRATERALAELKKAKRPVAVAFKETGLHQIADQLSNGGKFARFASIVREADGCIASTPEAAELLRAVRGESVAFIPTPCPIEDENWNWAADHRTGIFVGTREFDVPSRNHLAAMLAAKKLSEAEREPVTVFNLDRRRGARLIEQIGFRRIRVHEKRANYRAYLGEVARHKIIFQLDRSRVPGQVAGDALLCRSVCVGGDGAIDRIAFPETCGEARSMDELVEIGRRLLADGDERRAIAARATAIAMEKLSFRAGREKLAAFFAG